MNIEKEIFKKNKILPVDKFFDKVLYNKKYGYYLKKYPFGSQGDFITSPIISSIFGEMISIWLISVWEKLGEPKDFNIIELGPGNGYLSKIFLKVFKKFKKFHASSNIYLYEKSPILKKIQKKNILDPNVKWISNFSTIKKGPVFFIGNEFFDAIPIKQFQKKNGVFFEVNFTLNKKNKIEKIYRKAKIEDIKLINHYKLINKNKFIEFPKMGLFLINKILRKIIKNSGGIMLIDYGYLKSTNFSSLQSVKNHKKKKLFDDLSFADVTSLVNFKLLEEHFKKKKLKVKKIVTQGFFLKKLGILERANILSKEMNFKEKSDLYYRIQRLIDPKIMGELFKIIFASSGKNNNFIGFD